MLRHTAAVWMTQASAPQIEIVKILGHSDTRMVERHYAEHHPSYQSRGIQVLDTSVQTVEATAKEIAAQKAVAFQFHATGAKREEDRALAGAENTRKTEAESGGRDRD